MYIFRFTQGVKKKVRYTFERHSNIILSTNHLIWLVSGQFDGINERIMIYNLAFCFEKKINYWVIHSIDIN